MVSAKDASLTTSPFLSKWSRSAVWRFFVARGQREKGERGHVANGPWQMNLDYDVVVVVVVVVPVVVQPARPPPGGWRQKKKKKKKVLRDQEIVSLLDPAGWVGDLGSRTDEVLSGSVCVGNISPAEPDPSFSAWHIAPTTSQFLLEGKGRLVVERWKCHQSPSKLREGKGFFHFSSWEKKTPFLVPSSSRRGGSFLDGRGRRHLFVSRPHSHWNVEILTVWKENGKVERQTGLLANPGTMYGRMEGEAFMHRQSSYSRYSLVWTRKWPDVVNLNVVKIWVVLEQMFISVWFH